MPDPNELKASLERLLAGAASDADRNAIHTALKTGVLVTGERAVAFGGNVSDAIITTGDGNVVLSFKGADADTALAALRSVTPTRLHQMPPPPADFTGRQDELRELLDALEHDGVTILGLHGLGGVGKTALALKLCEQLKPRYPEAQLYLDLKGAGANPLPVAEALAHVIRSFHPAAKLPDSENELRGLYLSVLEGQRTLLLMDNAAGAEQLEPLIPPAGCLLLVTSRRHLTLPGMRVKNLDILTAAEARALLLVTAPRIGARADEIATLCGHLPLALRLAAGALAKYVNLKPEAYAQRLQNRQHRLQLIEASLSLSYELLSEELQERWRGLAVFPDSFAEDAAAAVWKVDMYQAQDTLGELIAASMVEWNETTGRYRLHDLAELFADAKLTTAERSTGQKRHATHYRDVLAAVDDLYLQGGEMLARGLALLDLEWGNIHAGHTWVAAQDVEADQDAAHLGMTYPHAAVYTLSLRLRARERIRWLEIALAAARRLKNRAHESAALTNLGIAYASLGETKRAIQFYEQQLVIAREIGYRRGEGNALGNLANAYSDLGDTRRAIEFYEQTLLIDREIGDHRGEGIGLVNLGLAYVDLGETKRAIQLYEEALIISREVGDRRNEGNALGNLGGTYLTLGETDLAIQFLEQQLTIVREIGDRTGEGNGLWNMSLALNELGDRAQAIQYAKQALIIQEQIEDPGAARVRERLAEWRGESDDD